MFTGACGCCLLLLAVECSLFVVAADGCCRFRLLFFLDFAAAVARCCRRVLAAMRCCRFVGDADVAVVCCCVFLRAGAIAADVVFC